MCCSVEMIVSCDIIFARNSTFTFFSGDIASGDVKFTVDKANDVQDILLEITGWASTSWRVKTLFKSTIYNGDENYIRSVINLHKSDNGERLTLNPGSHVYSFNYQLPTTLPTSFEGRHGSIRYLAQVKFIRPWSNDQTYVFGFTVLQPNDFNFNMTMPSSTTAYKTFCCGSCRTDPLELKLSIPQNIYVPGQAIPITVLVVNNTFMSVSELEFSLIMLIRYFSTQPVRQSHVERIVVTKQKASAVQRKSSRSLTATLPIPPTPPSCLAACNLLQIAYHVAVEVKMPAFQPSTILTLPVTIGTTPLQIKKDVILQQPKKQMQLSAGALNAAFVSDELSQTTTTEQLNSNTNSKPLGYAVCKHTETANIRETVAANAQGQLTFAPFYPVYKF